MKKIAVGSANPVKLEAAKQAFEELFPDEDFEVEGITVTSGVSEQPMHEEEFQHGSLNRAKAAKRERPDADYWVGLEGGCQDFEQGIYCWAWMTVLAKDSDLIGTGSTGKFLLPKKTAELVREGMELGPATDSLHNRVNSKQDIGTSGVLTNGVMHRTRYYRDGVILALIPFLNKEIY